MSLLRVAVPLASLFFFSAFAVAQVYAPSCTLTAWEWTYNSLNQGPCLVLGYMFATCDNGYFNVSSLPPGSSYGSPGSSEAANLCYCNTVGYSLVSACAACQGGGYAAWSTWVASCTKTLPPPSFPNPVPSGTRVPHWALLDVTDENYWNPNKSYSAGDTPEVGSGSLIGPSSMSATPTHSLNPSSSSTGSPTPLPSGRSSKAGAIAGGVAGGIAAITIVIAAIFYLRRRSQATSAASAGVGASQSQQPLSDEIVSPSSSGSPTTMKFYDPNDPTTFPGYQGSPHSQDIPYQAPMSSYIGTGSSLGNTQTSLPRTMGYRGHPTV